LGTPSGHYLYFMETDRLPRKRARVITDFLNTTGICLMFFYRFIGQKRDSDSSILTVSINNVGTISLILTHFSQQDFSDVVTK